MKSLVETNESITRTQLYELVWKVPLFKLAKELGHTPLELKRTCERYSIPCPRVGHWSKVAHGKPVEKTPLPTNEDLDKAAIEFDLRSNPHKDCEKSATTESYPRDVAQTIASIQALLPIRVPHRLIDPHKLVARTERAIRHAVSADERDRYGQFSPSRWVAGPCLAISVTKSSVSRSLRLANSILRGAITAGLDVNTTDERQRESICIKLLGESFSFSIHERKRQVPHVLTAEERAEIKQYGHAFFAPKIDYVGTGDLTINIWPTCDKYRAVVWRDDKRVRLEDLIGEILLRLPVQVQSLRSAREFQRISELKRQQEQQLSMRREQQQRRRAMRIEKLLKLAEQWQLAENLRGYARAVAAANTRGGPDEDVRFQKWFQWVLRAADQLDPVTRHRKPRPIGDIEPRSK